MADPTSAVPSVISLDEIMTQARRLQDSANDAAAVVLGSVGGMESATKGITTAERTEAEAKNEGLRAAQDITLRKNRVNTGAAADFGTDPRTSSSIITEFSRSIKSEELGVQAEAKSLEAKQKLSPFDDFVGWFQAQFELPGEEIAHGTRVAALNTRMGVLERLQKATHDQIALNEALDTNTSDAAIAAKSKENLAAAAKSAAEAQFRLQKTGLEVANIRLAQSSAQLHAVQAVHSAQVQENQLAISKAHLDLAERTRLINVELKNLQVQEKEDKMVAEKNWNEKLFRASAVLGLTMPITYKDLTAMSPDMKHRVESIALDPDIQAGRLGSSPWSAAETALTLNAPLTPAIRAKGSTLDLVRNQRAGVIGSGADSLLWKQLDPAVKETKMKANFDIWIKQQQNNIPETGGLYSAPSLSSIGKIPAVANTSLYKELAPLARDPEYATKPQEFFNTAVKKIKEGGNPDQIARELSGIFKAIAIDNSAQKGYARFALPLQDSYKTIIDAGLPYGDRSQSVDMTNYSQVGNLLLRSAGEAMRAESRREIFKNQK